MTEAKPNAIDMLKLDPDAFMAEVSRVVSEKPWEHTQWNPNPLGHSQGDCSRCGKTIVSHRGGNPVLTKAASEPCPIPPRLTESPEWWAFRLRDQVDTRDKETTGPLRHGHGMEYSATKILRLRMSDPPAVIYQALFYATPFEQMACSFVALGEWDIGEET